MKTWLMFWRQQIAHEIIPQWIAYHLPRDVVYFAHMRLMNHATAGGKQLNDVDWLTAIRRWEEDP